MLAWLASALAVTATASLAAAPPPPPPPAAEIIPYRPVPPGGASYAMDLPPLAADGRWVTVNSNLDADGTLWHFRSAWNVAALNCLDAGQGRILEGYGAFLKKYARALTAANDAIDQRFRREHGSRSNAVKAREAYMTRVYNYFALPPARADFCNAALAVSNEFLAAQPDDPKALAAANLPRLEAAYQEFFRQYQQYQDDSAAWDQRYGARYGASQPGYVAIYGSRIPVIPAPEGVVTTPVVEPVAEDAQR